MMLTPKIVGEWWTIATNPVLGGYSTDQQETMDFGIWQAADGSWQLGACIRETACGGHGRLLYRWQSASIEASDWIPKGIIFEADPLVGETLGGLQAPYVIRDGREFVMVYGDWVNICMAISADGKSFNRRLNSLGQSAQFGEGENSNTRDPMLFKHEDKYFAYYTGVIDGSGAIYCRTSENLRDWSESCVVSAGGSGGSGASDAECAFVCYQEATDNFYLFRWHSDRLTSVYQSAHPMDFGINDDSKRICVLPIEVARIIEFDGNLYISSLLDDYTGIRLARMAWLESEPSSGCPSIA